MGCVLSEAKFPEFPAAEVAGLLIGIEAVSAFEPFFKNGGVTRLKDPWARYQDEIAGGITGADSVKLWRLRRVLQEKMSDFFSKYDYVVTPSGTKNFELIKLITIHDADA